MILVVGSTGFLGSEICRQLVAAGKPVRGMVRSTSALEKVERLKAMGVQTVFGDLRDPASLASACQGVDTVITTATTTISMQPGDSIPVTDQQGTLDLVKTAQAAGVGRFVYTSVPLETVECPLTVAKRTVEQALKASELIYTILRPGIIMEIWLSPLLGFDYPNAKATLYGDGHTKLPYITLGDVARYVLESLTNPAARNATFELCYPQTYSLLEVVHIFEKIAGRSFELQFVPEAALSAQRAAATDPLQISFASLMLNMTRGIRFDSSQARKVFSFPLTSVDDYAQRVLATMPA
jgi:NADH dehydrogenase